MLCNFPLVITLNKFKASCGIQDFIWCCCGRLLSHEGKFEGRFPRLRNDSGGKGQSGYQITPG
jgi:hypothetical protein